MVAAQIEALVDDIEAELQQRALREVTSAEIGEAVLKNLQRLSEVAYVRFASVYRQFQGIRDFVDELNYLKNSQNQLKPPASAAGHPSGNPDFSGSPAESTAPPNLLLTPSSGS